MEEQYKIWYAMAVEGKLPPSVHEKALTVEEKLRARGVFQHYSRRGDLRNVLNGGRPKYSTK